MAQRKLAIFDIDGTIFRKNLSFELINELSWLKIFPKSVRKDLVKHYSDWLDHKGTYEDYRRALVDLYDNNIKGCKKEDIIKASQIVVPFYKNRVYIFATDLIEKLRKENYKIIAISGSPIEVVEEFNRYLKFDAVYGSVYEIGEDGKYTGNTLFEPPHHKDQVARQYMVENNLTLENSYGVGDTESDAKFLEIVEHPIAFNPNYNLKKIAEERGWRIVVEKKDVIYEIK